MKLYIDRDKFHTVRPGDVIVAVDARKLEQPRTVELSLTDGAIRLVNPNPESKVIHNLYADQHHFLTVERKMTGARRFATAKAAAKAWGRERGIVNRGGSLYWDVEGVQTFDDLASKRQEVAQLADAAGLGYKALYAYNRFVGDRVITGWLVTGYGSGKGWEVLSERLIRRGAIKLVDGKYEVQA